MQLKRRVLYNSLRMNWLSNPDMQVQPWQVEDYRSLTLDQLFSRLGAFQIFLDKQTFQMFAENVDSPEDLTDEFLSDTFFNNEEQDEVYLLVFELWRRLITDRKSLSIFLDELDQQIYLYDHGKIKNPEGIQDVLEELSLVLDENIDRVDSGIDSRVDLNSLFETISSACANDLESFLYDYISEQIDNQNYLYASELLDNFSDFMPEAKWFEFLRTRIQADSDVISANQTIRKLMHQHAKEEDLEFNLELLSFIAKSGERDIFINLVKKSIPLIELEEDFIDLVILCSEYFERLDRDQEKQLLDKLLENRSNTPHNVKFIQSNQEIAKLLKICENH